MNDWTDWGDDLNELFGAKDNEMKRLQAEIARLTAENERLIAKAEGYLARALEAEWKNDHTCWPVSVSVSYTDGRRSQNVTVSQCENPYHAYTPAGWLAKARRVMAEKGER